VIEEKELNQAILEKAKQLGFTQSDLGDSYHGSQRLIIALVKHFIPLPNDQK
jgi:hypothetical protein